MTLYFLATMFVLGIFVPPKERWLAALMLLLLWAGIIIGRHHA